MPNHDRRAAARRKAWGRGPAILRFEPMEGRQLLSVASVLSSIAAMGGTSTAGSAAVGSSSTDTTTSIQSALLDSTTAANLAATASANAAGTTETNLTSGATTTATAAPTASDTASTDGTTQTASTFDGSNLVQTSFDSSHNADWGQTLQISGTVQNEGSTANLQAYEVDVYASTSPSLNANSTLVAAVPVAAGLKAGTSSTFNEAVNAPAVPMADIGTSASYYLVPRLVVSGGGGTNPSTVIGAPLTSVVTVTPKALPMLQGAGLSVNPGSISWGGSVTVNASVYNNSSAAAPATNARIILTPTGQAPGGGLDYEIGQVAIPPVGAFQTVNATQTLVLPTYAPSALASSSGYTVTMVQDANATANPLVTSSVNSSPQNTTSLTIATPPAADAPTDAKPAPADLVVVDVQEPTPAIYRGGTFTVGATVRNIGTGDAGTFKVRFLLVTDPSSTAPAYVLGDATLPGLKSGMEQSALQVVSLPYTLPAGFSATYPTAQVVAQVDPDNAIDESSTASKTLAAAPVTFSVLSPTSTTSVPVLPGGTTSVSSTGGATSTVTTAPIPSPTKASASAFTSVSITGDQVPGVAVPAAATTTGTTTATATKAATVHTQVATKLAAAKALAKAKVQAKALARVKAQELAKAKLKAARQHALKLYHPAAKLAHKGH